MKCAVFIICFSLMAQAQDLNAVFVPAQKSFFIDSIGDFGERIYYNCYDVEYKLRSLLKLMGARNAQVQCSGGIDSWQPPVFWESSVYMKFSTLRLSKESHSKTVKVRWVNLKIDSYDNCHLYYQVFNRIKNNFELRNLQGPNYCSSVSRRFLVRFDTLKSI